MKPPRIPERIVQRQIVALLRSLGGLVWVLGTSRPRTDSHHGTCQTPGIGDVYAIFPRARRSLWVEVKAAGGKLRPAQVEFQSACLHVGQPHIVGGVDEVLGWLQQQGIVKPESVPWYRQDGAAAKSPILAAPRRAGAAQDSDARLLSSDDENRPART